MQHVTEDHRPQVDEHDLDVEGDEQQGVDVEGKADAAPRVAERVDARLVGQALVAIALGAMAEQPGGDDRDQHERRARESEPEHVPQSGRHMMPFRRHGPRFEWAMWVAGSDRSSRSFYAAQRVFDHDVARGSVAKVSAA